MDNLQKKKASWDTTKKLHQTGRISLKMALYCLKSTGHTKEEAAEWLKEIQQAEK